MTVMAAKRAKGHASQWKCAPDRLLDVGEYGSEYGHARPPDYRYSTYPNRGAPGQDRFLSKFIDRKISFPVSWRHVPHIADTTQLVSYSTTTTTSRHSSGTNWCDIISRRQSFRRFAQNSSLATSHPGFIGARRNDRLVGACLHPSIRYSIDLAAPPSPGHNLCHRHQSCCDLCPCFETKLKCWCPCCSQDCSLMPLSCNPSDLY